MIKTTIPLLRGKQEREFVACEHSWGVCKPTIPEVTYYCTRLFNVYALLSKWLHPYNYQSLIPPGKAECHVLFISTYFNLIDSQIICTKMR